MPPLPSLRRPSMSQRVTMERYGDERNPKSTIVS
jgi:hypothetical protein